MPILRTIAAAATLAAVLAAVSPSFAYDSVDECINEETFKCLDDDDFWVCYDFILEDCKNHGLSPPSGAVGFTSNGGGHSDPTGPKRLTLAH